MKEEICRLGRERKFGWGRSVHGQGGGLGSQEVLANLAVFIELKDSERGRQATYLPLK